MIAQDELDVHLKPIKEDGFEINHPDFAKLKGWNDILLQLTMARFFLATLSDLPDDLGDLENAFTKNAYFIAFLTTYGKCFTAAGGHRISLDEKDAFKEQPEAVREGHDRIMALRHAYAAHNLESGLVVTHMAAKVDGNTVHVRHLITQAMPLGELKGFSAVLDGLEHYVAVRLNSRLNKIEAQIGKAILLE
jgi:hypothetical protein